MRTSLLPLMHRRPLRHAGFSSGILEGSSEPDPLPAWFPWDRFRNVGALWHYARAIGTARAGTVKNRPSWECEQH